MSYYSRETEVKKEVIMYEMYPESWWEQDQPIQPRASQRTPAADRPHRRPRKEHSVRPPVVVRALAEQA